MNTIAAKGIRLVLWGEFLELISRIAFSSVSNKTSFTNLENAIIISSLILSLISCIMIFVGLVKAGKAEKSFGLAWALVLGYFISMVAVNAIWMSNPTNAHVNDFIPALIDFIVTIFIFRGLLNLLEKNNKTVLYDKTKSSFVIYTVLMSISLVIVLVDSITGISLDGANNTVQTILFVTIILYLVLLIIAYIKYLVALSKTASALERELEV